MLHIVLYSIVKYVYTIIRDKYWILKVKVIRDFWAEVNATIF